LAKKHSERKAAEEPSFEQALEQLEGVVRQLEEGEIGLSETLKQYERGVKLLRRCYDLLEGAERRIELLGGVDAQGRPISTPLDDLASSQHERSQDRDSSTDPRNPPPKRGYSGAGDSDMDPSEPFS
jgi:exodeoxyribonuclease VII small subunit